MRNALVIILFTFAEANAKDSTDKLADGLVDRLVDRLFNKVLGQSAMARAPTGVMKMPSPVKPTPFFHQVPRIPQGSTFGTPSTPQMRGAVVPKGFGKEAAFHYEPMKFDYQEVPPADVDQLLNKGWVLLDVRQPEQVERAAIHGADQVPLYVLQNDFSPLGMYQEAVAFGLGGWWMGGRPMKENSDFVKEVQQKIGKGAPGIIAVCQSGLRSKQALKELHIAGYPNLALVKGGLNRVKHNELPCEVEGCRLDLAGSGNVAGALQWQSN